MPVFARTKIVLQEDCYREKPERMQIKYVGPNAIKLYHKSYDLIKAVFRASDTDLQEEKYNWGKGETEKFSVSLLTHKDMDMFSYIYLKAELKADGNEKTGNAVIRIKPYMRTEYPQDTVWQRSLFYEMLRTIWHRMFYAKKREEYTEECRHLTYSVQEKLREYFRELREMH